MYLLQIRIVFFKEHYFITYVAYGRWKETLKLTTDVQVNEFLFICLH
jgi:hypothetical protein